MTRTLLYLFLLCCIISCDSKKEIDCSAVLCDVANNSVYIQFIDSETDENLLDNETILEETIDVKDMGNTEVPFITADHPDYGKILLFSLSPTPYGNKSFTITFEGGSPFTISFATSYIEGGCCGPFTAIDDIEISTYTHEYSERGYLPLEVTILVD
ncbi:hypothetical protein [Flagellimonas iocasae]|uniref:Lipoprotein n=1 Tax=Flagellimonas iocasae TaxID=2055905 RepID=A0ABW4XX19_9FLAO